MNSNKLNILFFLTLLVSAAPSQGQDVHFSQFYEAPLLRNPALAGVFTGDYRVQGVYRNQWNSFVNAYQTGSFNAEYKMPVGKTYDYFTTALEIFYDKAGSAALSTTELLPTLNYHKSLSNDRTLYLSLAFMGGLVQKSIDLSKVTTNSQYNGTAYDPALPQGESFPSPSVHYLDGSLGITLNKSFGPDQQNAFYLGAALFHLNRPKNSFYQNPATELDPKYTFCGGIKTIINDYSYYTLQGDYTTQGGAQEIIGGVIYSYKLGDDPSSSAYVLHLGGLIRWRDAFIPTLKIDMNSLSAGISYDVNISELQTASQGRGGFELTISYIGLLDRENPRYKTPCPRF